MVSIASIPSIRPQYILPIPPGRRWLRTRCVDRQCGHQDCATALDEHWSYWYDKARLAKDEFDPKLPLPHSAEKLKELYPLGQQNKVYLGEPWPLGNLCKPETDEEKRDFFKSNPDVIRFLHDRKVEEIKEADSEASPRIKEYAWVHQTYGPCFLTCNNPHKRGTANWRGGSLTCSQVGALMNLIESNGYTVAKALDPDLEGSHICHMNGCMSWQHLVWEHWLINRDRGSWPRNCVGFVRVYSRRTGHFVRMRRVCGHSPPCLFVSDQPEYV